MNLAKIMGRLFCVLVMCFMLEAHADENANAKQLIQNFYQEDVKALLCHNPDGEQNKSLVIVPERYLSTDFMLYYRRVCVNLASDWVGDIRTGEPESYSYAYSKAGFTNLNIGQSKIKGSRATIRATYDLPQATYGQYGNFTLFKLIKENDQWKIDDIELGGHDMDRYNKRESMTALISYKSVKQYIKKSLKEAENNK